MLIFRLFSVFIELFTLLIAASTKLLAENLSSRATGHLYSSRSSPGICSLFFPAMQLLTAW